MYNDRTVAVVVPAYNEAGRVGAVIDRIPDYVDRVYVVDDGSTDDTWAELTRHADVRNDEHDGRFDELVVPIRHAENRGVGGAIKTGYRRAREERIDATAVLAGDDQMDPDELDRLLDPIVEGRAEYAKGTRFARLGDWAGMPTHRLVGNVVLSYLTKIASGYWRVMDSQNGYAVISLSALERADVDAMYEYYGYCNDLLVRLAEADCSVVDVPHTAEYAYREGWSSHISLAEYVPRVSVMLLRGFCRRLLSTAVLRGPSPAAALYPLGAVTTAASGLGLALGAGGVEADGADGGGGSSSSSTAEWLLTGVVGLSLLLIAAVVDARRTDHLQASEDRAAAATADDPEATADPRGDAPASSERVDDPATPEDPATPVETATPEDPSTPDETATPEDPSTPDETAMQDETATDPIGDPETPSPDPSDGGGR